MSLENPLAQTRSESDSSTQASNSHNLLDLLKDYKQPSPASTSVADNGSQLNMSSPYNPARPTDSVATNVAAPAAPADTHDYTVKSGDSLWKISYDSLAHDARQNEVASGHAHGHGHHRHPQIQAEQVWGRMHDILQANRDLHPEISGNPFFIKKGDHLNIPGIATTEQTPGYSRIPRFDTARPPAGPGASSTGEHNSDAHSGRNGHGRGHAHESGPAAALPSDIAPGDSRLSKAMKTEAAHQAQHIDTVNDCARGPRQTMETFGIKLDPMAAVRQGNLLLKSEFFDLVKPENVKEGDYGYRHWSAKTIARRGVGDLGDSFIVTNCTQRGWQAANDHMFQVPPAGNYYKPGIVFLRPNAKFYEAVNHYKETGEKTVIRESRDGKGVVITTQR